MSRRNRSTLRERAHRTRSAARSTFELWRLLAVFVVVASATGAATILACSTSGRSDEQLAADAVFLDGQVLLYPDGENPMSHRVGWAQAVAVDDGRISYVGDDRGASRYIGAKTQVIDLDGRILMPGLGDGHLHGGVELPARRQADDEAVQLMPEGRMGTGEVTIDAVRFLGAGGQVTQMVRPGEPMAIELDCTAARPVDGPPGRRQAAGAPGGPSPHGPGPAATPRGCRPELRSRRAGAPAIRYRSIFTPARSRSQVSGVSPRSRSLYFWTRPVGVWGSSSTNST